jgi:hypothetical protein
VDLQFTAEISPFVPVFVASFGGASQHCGSGRLLCSAEIIAEYVLDRRRQSFQGVVCGKCVLK